jgi:glycosyltransferase involved in cell wall biosynthesis
MSRDVGLLIATRNRAAQLALALGSIRARIGDSDAYTGLRTLVVDDGSVDDTMRVLDAFADIVTVHRIARGGGYRNNPGSVLNAGHRLLDAAVTIEQGGEVAHLTDCVGPLAAACCPGTVALATVYNGTPGEMVRAAGAIAAGGFEFSEDVVTTNPQTDGDRWPVPRVGPLDLALYCGAMRAVPFLFLGAIHRDDFEAVSGYDEERPGRNDEDLANRLIARGVRFVHVGRAVAFHLIHRKA